jgi:predicted TIM-barrel fold metal-dependent hydrolase
MVLAMATTDDPGVWHNYIDQHWLAQRCEEILDPDLPIIDAHHHVWWERPFPYRFDQLVEDLGAGHNIRATVYMESNAMYRADGPEQFKTVGEIEYANGLAAMSASGLFGSTRACAVIVGYCDLTAGDSAEEVLLAQIAAGNGRFRGVRIDPYHDFIATGRVPARGLLADAAFRRGFARLAPLGLVADAMCLHTQLFELADLASAFPETQIVLNHVGGPTQVGPFSDQTETVAAEWSTGMQAVARCSNVSVKLGGLGNPFFCNLNLRSSPEPPSSEDLSSALRPWMEPAIAWFGPGRCMFESNFPPDKFSCSYAVLWNAFKRLAQPYSKSERNSLFHGTAARVYGLSLFPA